MSIRLRLTLLYTGILALTLLVFGLALYNIQEQNSLSALRQDLIRSSERLRAIPWGSELPPPRPQPALPPQSFSEFIGEPGFQEVREQDVFRILDPEGNLLASPFGREEDALPLSDAGLALLQSGQEAWETGVVTGEKMLIYSRAVAQDGQIAFIVQVARSLVEHERTLEALARTLVLAGALTVVLAFGVGWALSGYSLRPIQRITQTAQAIGEERDFSRRVDYDGPPDEVGQLAGTFNLMLSSLQDAYQKVEHSLAMQRDFVADVSHELRTPLTTLRGNLGLLRRNPPTPPEEQADILVDMVDESDRMIRLVNELLLLARADAGRNLAREPIPVGPALEEAVRQAAHLDAGRTITLAAEPGLAILGDRDALKQILLSLLDNALKHSAGPVEVSAASQDAQIVIRVQDHGPGIAPERLERIFDRFYRGDDDPLTPGHGLGLSIAKALTQGMGGNIAMESVMGAGSCVVVWLPAA